MAIKKKMIYLVLVIPIVFLLIFCILACGPTVQHYFRKDQFPDVKRIAMLPFVGDGSGEIADSIGLCLRQKFLDTEIIERTQMQRLASEQDLIKTGRMDRETMGRIGGILGVQAIIIGQVKIMGSKDFWTGMPITIHSINVRIVNTETGAILMHMETEQDASPIPQHISSLCKRIKEL